MLYEVITDASKDKKEAPKGIIQSKNATFVHQSTSSSNNFRFFLLNYFISVKNCFFAGVHGVCFQAGFRIIERNNFV